MTLSTHPPAPQVHIVSKNSSPWVAKLNGNMATFWTTLTEVLQGILKPDLKTVPDTCTKKIQLKAEVELGEDNISKRQIIRIRAEHFDQMLEEVIT